MSGPRGGLLRLHQTHAALPAALQPRLPAAPAGRHELESLGVQRMPRPLAELPEVDVEAALAELHPTRGAHELDGKQRLELVSRAQGVASNETLVTRTTLAQRARRSHAVIRV